MLNRVRRVCYTNQMAVNRAAGHIKKAYTVDTYNPYPGSAAHQSHSRMQYPLSTRNCQRDRSQSKELLGVLATLTT